MIELIKERLKETKEVREFRKSMPTKYTNWYLIKEYSKGIVLDMLDFLVSIPLKIVSPFIWLSHYIELKTRSLIGK